MITIYVVYNPQSNTRNFICDSQPTIDQGNSLGFEGVFSIGTLEDANNLIQNIKQSIRIPEGALWVGKEFPVEGGVKTITCDLSIESENSDMKYLILNSPKGDHLMVTGLQQAKETFEQVKQNYLNFCVDGLLVTLNKWPEKIKEN